MDKEYYDNYVFPITKVNFIINNLEIRDYEKIPRKVTNFFKINSDEQLYKDITNEFKENSLSALDSMNTNDLKLLKIIDYYINDKDV